MKILVVCQYYYPEPFKLTEICEELVKRGHIVTVLTGLPNYPDGVIPEAYRHKKLRNEIRNGVEIIRCFEIARKKGAVRLGINYLSFALSSTAEQRHIKNDFDIVFVYQQSPVIMAYPALKYKKRNKVPIYLYCCDIWPDSMKMYIRSEKNPFYKVVKWLSKRIYQNCELISVTSEPFIDYFINIHGIPRDRLTYLPQHSADVNMDLGSNEDNGICDFVFMGNIGIAQDIECILRAAKELKPFDGIKIHFVGDGSYACTAKQIVREEKLSDIVIFHGRHPVDKLSDFYRLADACLLTLKADSLVGLTMPSKLQGYMAAGKPIVGAINGAAQSTIRAANCGICVNAGDSHALAKAMMSIAEEKEKYKDCGKNAREYFLLHFTINRYIEQLEKNMSDVIGGK